MWWAPVQERLPAEAEAEEEEAAEEEEEEEPASWIAPPIPRIRNDR